MPNSGVTCAPIRHEQHGNARSTDSPQRCPSRSIFRVFGSSCPGLIDGAEVDTHPLAMDSDENRGSRLLAERIGVRPSARVSAVAQMMDCDQSQVRRLVKTGALESHRVGKRGLRIFLDSVAVYQESRTEQIVRPREQKQQTHAIARESYKDALATLRARGLLK